jgi:hypothetical protein
MLHELIVLKLVNYIYVVKQNVPFIFNINQEVLIYKIKQTNLFYSKSYEIFYLTIKK